MAWLDAENGLFHFVLAREDFYYTDSLCRLNLWQNLEWTLRQKGYCRIFRVENKKGHHWEIMAENKEFVFGGDTSEEFQNFLENHCEELFCGENQKTAFLIRSDLFAKLFSKEMGEFCERLEYLPRRDGIFIITVPGEEEAIGRFFQKSEGILKSDFFFHVRNHLQHKKEEESTLSILKEEMGECFYCLPGIKREEIRNMLFRNKVLGKLDMECEKIERLVDFLFFYLRSSDFQKEVHHPLPENQKMPLTMIERKLLEEGTLEKLKPILEENEKRIEAEKRKWIFQEAQEQIEGAKKTKESLDILKREGMLEKENEIELPLYHMMAVQYQDGRRRSLFYPGRYQIPDGEQVRQILLIRRKEQSFLFEWQFSQIPCLDSEEENSCYEISGSCQVQILSYGKGMASYLFREESYKKAWSFEELISENSFFIGSLKKRILKIIRGQSKEEGVINRKVIEEHLNRDWIYENGIRFFDFLVTEITRKSK